jgi:hypothetical protein
MALIHAGCPCCMSLPLAMLHVVAAYHCCLSILHAHACLRMFMLHSHAACPCCLSMLHVYEASPRSRNILHEHVECSDSWT